mmetsp:Transcript_103911/g.333073  ORF Transcript_103911/g.333073 Transcript_103911/m.333073 type:complete len:410 (-) Transcript_103911:107-1336(-)
MVLAVRAAVDEMPESKHRLIQEMHSIITASPLPAGPSRTKRSPVDGCAFGAAGAAGAGAAGGTMVSTLLPRIGQTSGALASSTSLPTLPGRPPRLPSAAHAASPGPLGRGTARRRTGSKNSSSVTALPSIPEAEPAAAPPAPLAEAEPVAAPPAPLAEAAPTAPSSAPTAFGSSASAPEPGALHAAVRAGAVEVVQALLASRADVDERSAPSGGKDRGTPAALAMLQGIPPGVLRVLLEGRADVEALDSEGRSLAHLWSWNLLKSKSAVYEEGQKLALLAQHGADLNARLSKTCETPLHILMRVFNGLSRAAEGGSEPEAGRSVAPRDAARFVKTTRCRIQLLVDAGADPLAHDSSGKTPLDLVDAAFRPSVSVLQRSGDGVRAHAGKKGGSGAKFEARHEPGSSSLLC